MNKLINMLILWMIKRNGSWTQNIITKNDEVIAKRFMPFWTDEWTSGSGQHHHRPPWFRPFNILLHRWIKGDEELMHDHPRWSITICLRGRLIEHTPWETKILTPGSVVFRSRKFIHRIEIPKKYSGKTWTIFIVGRRNHLQNYFVTEAYDKEY